jgi:hypothetical protein
MTAFDNGRTLCVECHRKTETWGNRLDIIKEKHLDLLENLFDLEKL